MEICHRQSEIEMRHLPAVDRFKRYGGRGQLFFWINRLVLTRPIHLSSMIIVGTTGLGGLCALEWAWHIRVTNLRCLQGYGIWINR